MRSRMMLASQAVRENRSPSAGAEPVREARTPRGASRRPAAVAAFVPIVRGRAIGYAVSPFCSAQRRSCLLRRARSESQTPPFRYHAPSKGRNKPGSIAKSLALEEPLLVGMRRFLSESPLSELLVPGKPDVRLLLQEFHDLVEDRNDHRPA